MTGLIGDDAIDGGIDLRPANGVSQHSRIYAIDPATGIATLASTLSSPLPAFLSVNGIDFDLVSDRLRVVTFSSPTRNLLIDVDTGEIIDQGRVSFAPGDSQGVGNPYVLGIVYDNHSVAATATTLYAVTPGEAPGGAPSNVLDIRDPPSTGTLHTVGLLGAFGGSGGGFDISGLTGTAYYATFASSGNPFYTVDLQTGRATLVGTIADPRLGNAIGGITAAGTAEPIPEPGTVLLFGTGLVGISAAAWRRARARPASSQLDFGHQAARQSAYVRHSRRACGSLTTCPWRRDTRKPICFQ